MAAKTQLGIHGTPTGLYGSFGGRAAAPTTDPHNPGEITRLSPAALPMGLYGSFAGKAAAGASADVATIKPTYRPRRR